ncbi:hypothetical protein [Thermopirellula anaerolimosa]
MFAHRNREVATAARCGAMIVAPVIVALWSLLANAAGGADLENAGAPPVSPGQAATSESPPIAGMRDFLSAFGIGESSLAQAKDGRPVCREDEEVLVRLLDRVSALQPAEISDWSEPPPDWRAYWERPEALRGRLFAVEGRLRDVQSVDVSPELAARSGIHRYHICTVTGERGDIFSVYARRVPDAWSSRAVVGDRVRASGIFMKWSGDSVDSPGPVLVADRPAWFPDNLLGRLGLDCALLDDIPVRGKTRAEDDAEAAPGLERFFLTGKDREAFYQMLAAAGRAKPGELYEIAHRDLDKMGTPTFPVVKLFNEPASQIGRLVLLYGTARRIERIEVQDADIRRRFGITHYYSIYLFTQDSQNNPLVCCVRELPPGVPLGEGPRYATDLAVAAFFYKTWGYRPERPASDTGSQTAWQLAPLLIGREALPLAESDSRNTAGLTAVFITGLLFVILIVWLWVWIANRRDREALSELRRRIGETPSSG